MKTFYHNFFNKQSGAGLIEIMIALVIGLVLLEGLGYFVVSNQKLNKSHDDISRMQESARIAMDVLGKAIRQAGYKLDVEQPFGGTPLLWFDGTDAGSDAIVVSYDPKWKYDATNSLAGEEPNCAGTVIQSNNVDPISGIRSVNTNLIVYGFYINKGQLYCDITAPTGTSPVAPTGGLPIVDLIEDMQITYGVEDANGNITGYVSGPTLYSEIVAVRVSLLIKGPTYSQQNIGQSYLYNGVTATANDGFLRQVYTSTFMLRNQL